MDSGSWIGWETGSEGLTANGRGGVRMDPFDLIGRRLRALTSGFRQANSFVEDKILLSLPPSSLLLLLLLQLLLTLLLLLRKVESIRQTGLIPGSSLG